MANITSVNGNSVALASGAKVDFPFPVGDAIDFDGVTVVRLEVPRGTIFNENVYGVASDGTIAWQIRPEYPPTWDAARGGLESSGGQAVLSNSESEIRYVNPKSGDITRREKSVR